MNEDRNLGVTEGRFALTLLICMLLAIGYVVLLRLGGSGDSTIEVRSGPAPPPGITRVDATEPEVLKVDGTEPATARRNESQRR